MQNKPIYVSKPALPPLEKYTSILKGAWESGILTHNGPLVQQFEKENHLRWDSLGEYLALAASLEHLGNHFNNDSAKLLGRTLDEATSGYLLNNKAPSRKGGELDNRGSHFYVALYWAQALAAQTEDQGLAERFAPIAEALSSGEETIVNELNSAQGPAMDVGGYYQPNPDLAAKAMRPSMTFNEIIDGVSVAS